MPNISKHYVFIHLLNTDFLFFLLYSGLIIAYIFEINAPSEGCRGKPDVVVEDLPRSGITCCHSLKLTTVLPFELQIQQDYACVLHSVLQPLRRPVIFVPTVVQ